MRSGINLVCQVMTSYMLPLVHPFFPPEAFAAQLVEPEERCQAQDEEEQEKPPPPRPLSQDAHLASIESQQG